nr:PREDICTED: eukaryotic translation initiation factor 2-alpha kinase 1-like [Bemisia tabaci]
MGDENLNTFANLKTDGAFDNAGDPSARQVTKTDLVQLNTSSLLIESLIEQWCNSLDVNPEEQHKLYLKICEKLCEKKLIDESFRQDKFKFMRSHYQKAFFHVINVAKNTQPEISNQQLMLMPRALNVRSENLFQWSRYRDDFEELEFIARGGFGHVYKAKNKLDNGIYAVKKIFLSYSDANAFLRSLHEVQMLAKLNHPNIVSYKAAWLEPVESKAKPPEPTKVSDDLQDEMSARLKNDMSSVVIFRNSSDSSSTGNHSSRKSDSNNHLRSATSNNHKFPASNASKSCVCDCSKSSNSNHSPSLHSNHSPSSRSNHSPSSRSNHSPSSQSSHSPSSRSSHSPSSRSNHSPSSLSNNVEDPGRPSTYLRTRTKSSGKSEKCMKSCSDDCKALCPRNIYAMNHFEDNRNYQDSAILFIQMQLCKQTLRQWLHSRNSSHKAPNLRLSFNLFEQVISGVEYIHSKNIVHHDIKPSNIFISENFQVAQVGDFGLACLLSHEPLNHSNNFITCPLQQRQFGTKLYAAPEQLQGTCTPKSDIYSLGIVLFELVCPFMTEMERVQVIGKLQTGYIAPEFQSASPEIAHIIMELVNKDPGKRPTAKELLTLVKNFRDMNSARFKHIADQNRIIEELRTELETKDKIISDLREKLRLYEEARKSI